MQVDPHRSGRGQADPPRLDDERRRMMSRACCAGPSVCCAGRSVPEGDNEHGALGRLIRTAAAECREIE